MKNIVIAIAISLLTAATSFAANTNNSSNNTKNAQISNVQVSIVINDMNGKTVFTSTYTTNNDSNINIKLNPNTNLPKGMYLVTVTIEGKKMTQKLVVE